MLDFLNFFICLMLFNAIAFTEAKRKKRDEILIISNMLKNDQWKTINDVEYVKYWSIKYHLEDMIRKKVRPYHFRRRVRIATLFLGCTTANFLYTIFNIFEYYRLHCTSLMGEDSSKVHGCVVDISNILPSINLMISKMRGAMDTFENYRGIPWGKNKRHSYILKSLTDFVKTENSYRWLPSKDDFLENMRSLGAVMDFNYKLKTFIDLDVDKFCQLKHHDSQSIWNEWVKEYENAVEPAKHSDLSKHLSEKIHEKIEIFIQENYTKLGFQYDTQTKRTIIAKTVLKRNNQTFHPIVESIDEEIEGIIDTPSNKIVEADLTPNNIIEQEPNTQSNAEDSEDLLPPLIEYPQHLIPFNRYVD